MKHHECCYINCPEPGTIRIGPNGGDSHWICLNHLNKWNADRARLLADGGRCEMQELGELLVTSASTECSNVRSMLWETKSDGLFRVVRLTRRFAFKTPHLLNRMQLKNDWRLLGAPGAKPSIAWRWKRWRRLLRENCSVNEREVERWLEWHRNGEQRISGVGLCPIRYYLRHGLLVVMSRADKVPAGRVDVSLDMLSNGFVSFEEMQAAAQLIGRNQDTSKPSTYGLIKGRLVVVDYGFVIPQ